MTQTNSVSVRLREPRPPKDWGGRKGDFNQGFLMRKVKLHQHQIVFIVKVDIKQFLTSVLN